MQHLATSSIELWYLWRYVTTSRRPPGVSEEDSQSNWSLWLWQTIKQKLRKLFWQPATPEIGILAQMVSDLRRNVEVQLGMRIKRALIASPDRVRLTPQEITDIFDYLGMQDLMKHQQFNQLFSMASALAANGYGLCSNYTHMYECYIEERSFPLLAVLQLDFSNHSLSGTKEAAETARAPWSWIAFVDLSLGMQHLPQSSLQDQYWRKIETRVRKFVNTGHVDVLLLTGESASDPRFIQAIKDALSDQSLIPTIGDPEKSGSEQAENFLFATSLGGSRIRQKDAGSNGILFVARKLSGKREHGNQKEL